MSFDELAKARGITKDSAVSLVRRHRWRRQRDNRGRVLVLVPDDAPEVRQRPPARLPDDRPSQSDDEGDDQGEQRADPPDDTSHTVFAIALEAVTKAHAGEVAALKVTIDELRAGQAMMLDMHARELDGVRRQLQEAQDAAAELRQADDHLIHNEEVKGWVNLRINVSVGLFIVFIAAVFAWGADPHDKTKAFIAVIATVCALPLAVHARWSALRELRKLRSRGWKPEAAQKARGRLRRAWAAWWGR